MRTTLEDWISLAASEGISKEQALKFRECIKHREQLSNVANISDSERSEPEPVLVAVYCELASLARISQIIQYNSDIRTRPRGVLYAGKEFALWGKAPNLSAWIGAIAGDRTGCQLVISLRHELANHAVATGFVAEGGNST